MRGFTGGRGGMETFFFTGPVAFGSYLIILPRKRRPAPLQTASGRLHESNTVV